MEVVKRQPKTGHKRRHKVLDLWEVELLDAGTQGLLCLCKLSIACAHLLDALEVSTNFVGRFDQIGVLAIAFARQKKKF
jgi:hypothetical protein